MRVRSRFALSLVVCAVLSLFLLTSALPRRASAERRNKPKRQQGLSAEELAVMLSSQDSDELRMAIESAALLRDEPAVTLLLAERVRSGLAPDLLTVAMDALVSVGDPKAGELLRALTLHRRAQVRARAALALSVLRTPDAELALVKMLSDQDAEVRSAALAALGEVGTKQSVPALFRALERNLEGAAAALGKLAEPSTIPRVSAYFGRVSFVDLAPLLDALLTRRDVPEQAKLTLTEDIVRHGSREARAYLEGLAPRLPEATPARLRKTIADALTRMPR